MSALGWELPLTTISIEVSSAGQSYRCHFAIQGPLWFCWGDDISPRLDFHVTL